jgi:hypothetical protein
MGAHSSALKRLAVAAASLVVVLATAAAVSAATSTSLTGTAEWTDQATTIHGTLDGRLSGTYTGTLTHVLAETTSECGPVCATVSGEITFSTNHGDFTAVVQPGSFLSIEEIASRSFRTFELQLTVVDGTKKYTHAQGSLSLSYTSTWSHFTSGDGTVVNQIDDQGTLSGNPKK